MSTKPGENLKLLKLEVTDTTDTIPLSVWGEKACMPIKLNDTLEILHAEHSSFLGQSNVNTHESSKVSVSIHVHITYYVDFTLDIVIVINNVLCYGYE